MEFFKFDFAEFWRLKKGLVLTDSWKTVSVKKVVLFEKRKKPQKFYTSEIKDTGRFNGVNRPL